MQQLAKKSHKQKLQFNMTSQSALSVAAPKVMHILAHILPRWLSQWLNCSFWWLRKLLGHIFQMEPTFHELKTLSRKNNNLSTTCNKFLWNWREISATTMNAIITLWVLLTKSQTIITFVPNSSVTSCHDYTPTWSAPHHVCR